MPIILIKSPFGLMFRGNNKLAFVIRVTLSVPTIPGTKPDDPELVSRIIEPKSRLE